MARASPSSAEYTGTEMLTEAQRGISRS
jgi:hypothetical protein